MNFKSVISLAFCVALACSCGSYRRLAYLQDMQVDYEYTVSPKPDARIQIGDKVKIMVSCSSPELAAPFNVVTGIVTYDPNQKLVMGESVSLEEKGYTVDREGNIMFPVIGKLHIEGLTLDELKMLVEGQIKGRNFIKDPMVFTEFLNFKVIVLGEGGVGQYNIPTGGVNIFELLAMSRDLTGDAIRSDVRVIRTENGIRKAYSINLQSVDCYDSPVFHLQQNDMVYVPPKDNKYDQRINDKNTFVNTMFGAIGTIMNVLLWSRMLGR